MASELCQDGGNVMEWGRLAPFAPLTDKTVSVNGTKSANNPMQKPPGRTAGTS